MAVKKKTVTKAKKTIKKVPKQVVKSTGCCEQFNPKPWDNKTKVFKNKSFVKAHYISLFHIPINFGPVIINAMKNIDKVKALPKDYFMMVDENSLFGADLYITVNKNVPGLENVKISGTFLTKVYEGPYNKMGEWVKDMNEHVAKKKKTVKKLYFYYTYCPTCAKTYGKNYVVILANI